MKKICPICHSNSYENNKLAEHLEDHHPDEVAFCMTRLVAPEVKYH